MKIKKFSTEIFAGINNRSYQFTDGLNILLGDNEAGKSTIINAIYAALFIEPQIKLNRTEGKNFKEQFFPYPDGDHVSAEIEFEAESKNYKIRKKWSNSNYQGYLELPDGVRIESQPKINKYRREIFPYGKSTYNNIVFSSQKDIKSTIERISTEKNPELIDTISSFLRKAVMELDGISIDKFRSKLEAELDELLKKWDLDSNSVANSDRGLNNPYKVGTGKIYDSYIAKESLRRKISETEVMEKRFSELSQEIKDMKSQEEDLLQKINSLEEIESDINQRANIELELKNLDDKLERLDKISRKWPLLKKELEEAKTRQQKIKKELQALEAEKERAEKQIKKDELKVKLNKIENLKGKINDLTAKVDNSNLSQSKVDELEKYKNQMDQTQASLKAAKLKAKINYSASNEIKVTTGVEAEREISATEIIEADGYIRIKTDEIDIEIESAEIDFSALQQDYKNNKNAFSQLKKELEVKDLSQAKKELEVLKELKSKVKQYQERIEELLTEKRLEDLKAELTELKDLAAARELKVVGKEIEKNKDRLNALETKIAVKKSNINDWKQDYQSLESLLELLENEKKRKRELKSDLNDLASLPEKYNSSKEFQIDLKEKRKRRDEINHELRNKLQEIKEIENSLPDNSTREMRKEFNEMESEFENLKLKARKLIKVKDVFLNKLEEMDKNSFKPLINSFSKNLKKLTAGKYEAGQINDGFEIELRKNSSKELPANLNLLSFGTYDAAALALRLAIFDNLFKNQGGFIILDDCLVNLDPERRKNALELINQFQKKYQIIYTTCNPERAEEFDANIINV